MKIVKLESENVKKLKAVTITPGGSMVIIGGKNEQGKTSTLDSIAYAIGGKSLIPSMPIRSGEEKAKITCDLGDLIVTRTITPNGGGTLTVSNKDGAKYPSPQSMLDKLIGKLSFDPSEFARMKPQDQLATLKQLVGIDFSDLENKRAGLFAKRTEVNRDGKNLLARFNGMNHHQDVPESPVSVSALMSEYSQMEEKNTSNQKERQTLSDMKKDVDSKISTASTIQEEIDDLNSKLKKKTAELKEAEKAIDDAQKGLHAKAAAVAKITDKDTAPIKKQIEDAESINEKIRENALRDTISKELEQKRQESKRLSEEITSIDNEKAATLSSAKFPIDDLSFDESGVTYKGVPFDQCSGAERLRVSVAMGFALNPELRVLLIRDGSLLDTDNLKMVADIAEKEGGQVWMERVGEGAECHVIIEDGTVKQS